MMPFSDEELSEYRKQRRKEWATTAMEEYAEAVKPELAEAYKADAGKPRWSLLPEDALEQVVLGMMHGAKKYSDYNWRLNGGFNYTRVYDSTQRHLKAWRNGEDIDADSKLPHLALAICNLLFLLWYQLNPSKDRKDDRKI